MFKDKNAFLQALQNLPEIDDSSFENAQMRQDSLTKPPGSLGRLEDLACWLAGWQGTETPTAEKVNVMIFAANHGITARHISPYPPSVTEQMVANFHAGGAAINQLCEEFKLTLSVCPIMLDHPTADITSHAAMTESDCLAALNIGASALNRDDDIVIPGEMGIGNTTIASIICATLYGGNGQSWAGAGTGLDESGVEHKANIIDEVLACHGVNHADPFTLLQNIGGREIAAICGMIVAARLQKIPVILDGFIVCAAAAILTTSNKEVLAHCVAGHLSDEQAHKQLLKAIGLFPPLLSLNMRLGEASGAALAVQLVRGAIAIHKGMASFEEAGIVRK